MAATLANLQSYDTHDAYVLFGPTDSDVQRLDQIPDEYAELVNNVTNYVASTLQVPLTDSDKSQIEAWQAQGDALVTEWKGILKRLQCTVEKTCSLSD
jgi:hypothetical protein